MRINVLPFGSGCPLAEHLSRKLSPSLTSITLLRFVVSLEAKFKIISKNVKNLIKSYLEFEVVN